MAEEHNVLFVRVPGVAHEFLAKVEDLGEKGFILHHPKFLNVKQDDKNPKTAHVAFVSSLNNFSDPTTNQIEVRNPSNVCFTIPNKQMIDLYLDEISPIKVPSLIIPAGL